MSFIAAIIERESGTFWMPVAVNKSLEKRLLFSL